MTIATLFKLARVMVLFFRELWLRDRTFRQFVFQNLPLVVMSAGFFIMSAFFVYVYLIVKDQDTQVSQLLLEQTRLEHRYTTEIAFLNERVEWYRSHYLEVVNQDPKSPDLQVQQTPAPPPPQKPSRTEKPVANRAPSSDLAERWKRLSQ